MITPRAEDNRPFVALFVSLIALSWFALLLWGASPYNRFLSHGAIGDLNGGVSVGYGGIALVFVLAWVLMTVAMMLPTALPLLLLFRGFVSARRNRLLLTALVIAGYLTIWTLFGIAVHLSDLGVHAAVARSQWLEEHSWILGSATLLIAGAYQFAPLKYLCLDKCRSPYSFVVQHWHGRRPALDALRLGIDHGLFCLGCCWSLMFLMFAIGMGNLAWMLGIGAAMAVEKNLPWGSRISKPLGSALLALGLSFIIVHAGLGTVCAHGTAGDC
jgi:predicted metal-binding membrane protein